LHTGDNRCEALTLIYFLKVVFARKMSSKHQSSNSAPCTMQISITDRDYAVARHVLPHQMRVIGKYASEVLISVNRFETPAKPELLDALLSDIASNYSNVTVEEIDYSRAARQWVSKTFFGGKDYPMFDYEGIPIHGFIEPFRKSSNPFFFRLECDMMLGGSGPWFNEAIDVLTSDDTIVAINPIAGPRHGGGYHSGGTPFEVEHGEAFKVNTFTTRTQLIELDTFFKAMNPLSEVPPSRLKDRIFTLVAGYPMVDHLEVLYQQKMFNKNTCRIDMGGTGGLWTLHPVFKTSQFLQCLPEIITKVEKGDMPQEQHGRFDLHKSVLNQTDLPNRSAQLKRLFTLAKDRIASHRSPLDLRSSRNS